LARVWVRGCTHKCELMPADRHYGESFPRLHQNPFYVGLELVERL
jgi:hypothetical protein